MTHYVTTKPTAEKATTHKGGHPKDPRPRGAARTRVGCKPQRGALKRQRVGVTYIMTTKLPTAGAAYHHYLDGQTHEIGSTTKVTEEPSDRSPRAWHAWTLHDRRSGNCSRRSEHSPQ